MSFLFAWSSSYMKSLARKQYPNAVIGTRYPNAVIWLVRDKKKKKTTRRQSDWWEINVHILMWRSLVKQVTYHPIHPTLYTDFKFFIKNNSKMRLRQYFNIILDFELRCSTNWEFQRIGQKAWLRARFVCGVLLLTRIIYVKSSLCMEKSERRIKFQA